MNIESYKKCSSTISLQGREKSVRKSSIRAVIISIFDLLIRWRTCALIAQPVCQADTGKHPENKIHHSYTSPHKIKTRQHIQAPSTVITNKVFLYVVSCVCMPGNAGRWHGLFCQTTGICMWSRFAPDMIAVYEFYSTVHSIIVDQAITNNLATASTYSATHALFKLWYSIIITWNTCTLHAAVMNHIRAFSS